MKIFTEWISWCLLSVCVIGICSAAFPTNTVRELDEFATHDQQAFASSQSKSSPLHPNRAFNRAVRAPQPSVAIPRSYPQQKLQGTQTKTVSTTAAAEEVLDENEQNVDETQAEEGDPSAEQKEEASSTPSSTEPVRRGLASGTVRPFRSNKDLLDRLKRRREMIQQYGYTSAPPTSTSTTERIQKNTPSTRKSGSLSNKNSGQLSDSSQKKSTPSSRRHNVKQYSSSTTLYNNDAIPEEKNAVSSSGRGSRVYPKNRRIS